MNRFFQCLIVVVFTCLSSNAFAIWIPIAEYNVPIGQTIQTTVWMENDRDYQIEFGGAGGATATTYIIDGNNQVIVEKTKTSPDFYYFTHEASSGDYKWRTENSSTVESIHMVLRKWSD